MTPLFSLMKLKYFKTSYMILTKVGRPITLACFDVCCQRTELEIRPWKGLYGYRDIGQIITFVKLQWKFRDMVIQSFQILVDFGDICQFLSEIWDTFQNI